MKLPFKSCLFALIVFGHPLQAQEQCIGIANDLQRLMCYDAWGKAIKTTHRPVEQIYEELAEATNDVILTNLSTGSVQDRFLEHSIDGCMFRSKYLERNGVPAGSFTSGNWSARATEVSIDLTKIDSLEFGLMGFAYYKMDRGETAGYFSAAISGSGVRAPIYDKYRDMNDLHYAIQTNDGFWSEVRATQPMQAISNFESVSSGRFQLVLAENLTYKADFDALFEELVGACKAM